MIKTPEFPTKNYDNNQTCEWSLVTDSTHTLTFQLTDFDLERSDNCSKDYLEILDPIMNKVLWKGCGNQLPNETFRSMRNELLIRLVSDSAISGKGFIGNYSINCGSRVITSDFGEMTYKRSTNENICYWTIIAEDPSKHVALTFSYFSIFFCYANIFVFEGDVDSLGAQRLQFCEGKVPPTLFRCVKFNIEDLKFILN